MKGQTGRRSVSPGWTLGAHNCCSASHDHVTRIFCRLVQEPDYRNSYDRYQRYIYKQLQPPSYCFYILYFVGWIVCLLVCLFGWVMYVCACGWLCAHAPDATCRCFIYVFYMKNKVSRHYDPKLFFFLHYASDHVIIQMLGHKLPIVNLYIMFKFILFA